MDSMDAETLEQHGGESLGGAFRWDEDMQESRSVCNGRRFTSHCVCVGKAIFREVRSMLRVGEAGIRGVHSVIGI